MRNKTRRYMESRATGYYPYYKLQWWNPVMMAWQDIQRRYQTPIQMHQAKQPTQASSIRQLRRGC